LPRWFPASAGKRKEKNRAEATTLIVLIEQHAGYRAIILNRPDRLNALTSEMGAALLGALGEAEAAPDCRAILLTGAGRGFCAGQDLTEVTPTAEGPPDLKPLLDGYNAVIRKLHAIEMPVVCAVNGVAAGAGANLALACDIVLAGKSASFLQAFARIGLIPDVGGTWVCRGWSVRRGHAPWRSSPSRSRPNARKNGASSGRPSTTTS
jgi:2-(1,2-epoxy-1,2-dihydrophenyl)acetyl-CoA isomerase